MKVALIKAEESALRNELVGIMEGEGYEVITTPFMEGAQRDDRFLTHYDGLPIDEVYVVSPLFTDHIVDRYTKPASNSTLKQSYCDTLEAIAPLSERNLVEGAKIALLYDAHQYDLNQAAVYRWKEKHIRTYHISYHEGMSLLNSTLNVAFGKSKRLFIKDLDDTIDFGTPLQRVIAIRYIANNLQGDYYKLGSPSGLNIRSFIKLCFETVGIEVEFSGKGNRERGVIIDIDELQLAQNGIHPRFIKFGETIVKQDGALSSNDKARWSSNTLDNQPSIEVLKEIIKHKLPAFI